jgi:hypothetical protein
MLSGAQPISHDTSMWLGWFRRYSGAYYPCVWFDGCIFWHCLLSHCHPFQSLAFEAEVAAKYGWDDVYAGRPVGASWMKARGKHVNNLCTPVTTHFPSHHMPDSFAFLVLMLRLPTHLLIKVLWTTSGHGTGWSGAKMGILGSSPKMVPGFKLSSVLLQLCARKW